jgi:hypothetical protein
VHIIAEKELPLNGAGKIDRNLARARLATLAESQRP